MDGRLRPIERSLLPQWLCVRLAHHTAGVVARSSTQRRLHRVPMEYSPAPFGTSSPPCQTSSSPRRIGAALPAARRHVRRFRQHRMRYDSNEGPNGPKHQRSQRATAVGRKRMHACMHASDRCSRYTAVHLVDELDALFDERIRFRRQIVPLLRLRCSGAARSGKGCNDAMRDDPTVRRCNGGNAAQRTRASDAQRSVRSSVSSAKRAVLPEAAPLAVQNALQEYSALGHCYERSRIGC